MPPAIANNRSFINGSLDELSHFKRYTTRGQRELIHSLLAVADSYAMLGRPLETLPQVEALIQSILLRLQVAPRVTSLCTCTMSNLTRHGPTFVMCSLAVIVVGSVTGLMLSLRSRIFAG